MPIWELAVTCECPNPPSSLHTDRVNFESIEIEQRLWRFHRYEGDCDYPGDSFNPATVIDWTQKGVGARFSPFPRQNPKSDRDYVPSLYAAATAEAAALESVFHDIPQRPNQVVSWKNLSNKHYHMTELVALEALKVVNLNVGNLRQCPVPGRLESLSVAELNHSWASDYPITRKWAKLLYESFPDIDGFQFNSRQSEARAFVFFEDRCKGKIKALVIPRPLTDNGVRMFIDKAAQIAAIDLMD